MGHPGHTRAVVLLMHQCRMTSGVSVDLLTVCVPHTRDENISPASLVVLVAEEGLLAFTYFILISCR